MAKPQKVLIDLNVLLDVLQARQPHAEAAVAVLAAAERGKIEGWLAAHSISTLYYLYAKARSPEAARNALVTLLSFLHVAPVDENVIVQALSLPYKNFEDAVQMAAALQIGAICVITRDTKDFRRGPLPAYSPAEYLPLLNLFAK